MTQAQQGAMTSQGNSETQDLAVLIGAGADASALAAYLDGLSSEARVREVQGLPGALLGPLYDACAKAAAFTLDDLVPPSLPAGQTVRYAGKNNLPLFRTFEKRFARTASGSIIGFNFQTMSVFTGPGYFTVTPAGNELLIDYTKVPGADEAPSDWPKVQPNNRGLSHFVYKNLHDYCRRVSDDVVIGHATRLGKSMPQYFVLARIAS